MANLFKQIETNSPTAPECWVQQFPNMQRWFSPAQPPSHQGQPK